MRILNLTDWKLTGFWPYTPLFGKSMETGFSTAGCTPCVDAAVPGSIHDALLKAGVIEDPYYEQNSLKCEWVSNRWWVYETTFCCQPPQTGRTFLTFKGIDYEAIFFLNGQKIGEHKGMYIPCRLDVTHLIQEQNFLLVVLKNAPEEMGQIGLTSQTSTQKARFGYKWDFSTRLVDLGLYDEVFVEHVGLCEIKEPYIRVANAGEGVVKVTASLPAAVPCEAVCTLTVRFDAKEILRQEQKMALTQGENAYQTQCVIPSPKLWYPNGYGQQPLYEVCLQVQDRAGSDSYTAMVGLRTLSYEQADGAAEGSLPYLIRVNGIRIYLKGANTPPLDLMYGRVGAKEYETMLGKMKRANMNLVRVWGGGLIEKDAFYEACDRLGILVWQEFIQSSSGMENVPSKSPEFLELLSKAARAALVGKRNHPSLAFWGGGNELMDINGVPSTYEDENIALLKGLCDELDPDRLMLPTSASGPLEFLNPDAPGQNHDVHGPWQYEGPAEHYRTFNRSDSQLHSEFGCNGMSSLSTLQKILAPQNQGMFGNENLTWRHHGEWWNNLQRDIDIVGKPKDLAQMVKIDQFIQAEAVRYGVEANSRRAFQNVGSIVWVFGEPYPNTANTSLVDYYGHEKLAYYLVGEAYSPLHCSLQYDFLLFQPGRPFCVTAYVHNDRLEEIKGLVEVEFKEYDGNSLGSVAFDGIAIKPQSRMRVGSAEVTLGTKPVTAVVRLISQNRVHQNRYLFLPKTEERSHSIAAVEAFYDETFTWALGQEQQKE